jgi:hypothetical protein
VLVAHGLARTRSAVEVATIDVSVPIIVDRVVAVFERAGGVGRFALFDIRDFSISAAARGKIAFAYAGRGVASVGRATEIIAAVDETPEPATVQRVAGFGSVAQRPVIAKRVVCRVSTRRRGFVAAVHGAVYAVVAINRWRRRLAIVDSVAGFDSVAEQSVVAVRVRRDVGTRISGFVAAVLRATYAVVASE